MFRPAHLIVGLVALLTLPLTACSSSGTSSGTSSGSSTSGSASATSSAPASSSASMGSSAPMSSSAASSSAAGAGSAPAAAGSKIVIDNFAFSPASLTVSSGQTVTVVNNDSTTHTVTATTGKAFDTGSVAPGATGTFTAPSTPGSYPYICSIHPFMHGTLVVK